MVKICGTRKSRTPKFFLVTYHSNHHHTHAEKARLHLQPEPQDWSMPLEESAPIAAECCCKEDSARSEEEITVEEVEEVNFLKQLKQRIASSFGRLPSWSTRECNEDCHKNRAAQ
jgi:flagella basal body P-ring formation protein FlgA